ncbi:MAG: MBG domain-containing protein [Kiritimatiellae bacterium]|nr:MBG domain-containing protein [Kiritimatiellia bacterium]
MDKASQSITFDDPGAQETTNTTVLDGSASSGLPITYSVVSGNADLSDQSNLTYRSEGTVVISASQSGNSNWYGATSVTQSFTVTKAVASVVLTNLTQTYNGSARSVGSVTSPTGLTVNITYNSSATAPTNTGSYTVIGLVNDVMYQGGATNTLTVNKAGQTITFPAIDPQNSTNTTHLSATSSSGLPVSFAVVSGEADLAGGTNLTYRSSGTVLIAASQAGDTNWSPAPTVTNSITVNKTAQSTLIFSPTNTMIYLTTNDLSTTGGSGTGAVSYAVVSGPGAITNDTALFINSGSGTIYVAATKAQDAMYQAQTVTSQIFCARADQEITFPVIADQAITNETLLSAAASSGLSVSFSVVSGSADLSDQTNLTYRGTGVVVIAASQVGDTNWNAAVNVTNSFSVYPVLPVVTTLSASAVDQTTFTSGGDVTFNGGAPVTQRGICWNLTGTPTTADFLTRDATGTGTYASVARGLTTGTTYYARAYAINEVGAGYGSEITVTTSNTPPPPPVVDYAWTGAADTEWANAANWSGGVVPVYSNAVVFASAGASHPSVNLSGDRALGGLVVNTNAGDIIEFNDGSLLLTNADSRITQSGGRFFIGHRLILGVDSVVSNAADSMLYAGDGIDSLGDFAKQGPGELVLGLTNILQGDFVLSGGSAKVLGDVRLASSGVVSVASGATLFPHHASMTTMTIRVTNEVPGSVAAVFSGELGINIFNGGYERLDFGANLVVLNSNSVLTVTESGGGLDITGRYTIVRFGGLNGSFGQVNGLTAHTLSYNSNSITLEPTFVWDGAQDTNWSQAMNWTNSAGATPGASNDAGFVASAGTNITVNLDTNPVVRSIRALGNGTVVLSGAGASITLTNSAVAQGNTPAVQGEGVLFELQCDINTVPGARFSALNATSTVIRIYGTISSEPGTGNFGVDGSGQVELLGTNTFGSATNWLEINAARLLVNGDGALGNPAAGVIFTNGGTLSVTNDLNTGRPMQLSGNGGMNVGSNCTLTLTNVITGSGSLTLTGDGMVVLTASNLLGGASVNGGTLRVMGYLESAGNVHVQSNATLGGRGTISLGGSEYVLHIRSGGILSPGASIGTLTVDGSLTVDGGWTVEVDGSSNDVVNVRDTLTLGAGSDLTITGTVDGVTAYAFATFASRSGAFGGLSLPQNYILTYGATNLVLMPRGNEMGSTNVTRDGGTLNIPVTEDSNTAWSVINTSSWITVTSSTNVSGSATVTLTVSANDGRERTGIAWIAGKQYIITQRANRAVYLDFDGDTLADIAVYSPEHGIWYILQSSLNTGRVQPWGWPDSVPAPGDYDGDGLFDVAVYCVTNGMWYVWQSDSESGKAQAWGYAGAGSVPADYDGDGITDFAVYDASAGSWLIWQSATQTARTQAWGWSGAEPVPGDYDGDGETDVAVYEAITGTWYIWLSATQTARIQPWGWAGAEPIPGDYDGDGATDVAVYQPDNGMWYAWLSASQTGSTSHWGWNDAWPVPADYDGDGKYDLTVYVPLQGMWYLWQSGSQTPRAQPWGFEGAEPVN